MEKTHLDWTRLTINPDSDLITLDPLHILLEITTFLIDDHGIPSSRNHGSLFQGYSDKSPRPWICQSILLVLYSRVSRVVAIVSNGPRAGTREPASRVRRSYCVAPRRPHPRARSSVAATDFRSVIVVHSVTLLPQCWGRRESLAAGDEPG